MEIIEAVLINVWMLVAAWGWGSWIIPHLPASLRRAERVALGLWTGLGVLGSLLFVIGSFHFSQALVLGLLSLGSLLAAWLWFRHGVWPKGKLVRVRPRMSDVVCWGMVIGVIAVVCWAGFVPPAGSYGHDEINYHLLGPKLWLRHGHIHPTLENNHTAFPVLIECLFAIDLALHSPVAANLLGGVALGLLCVQVAGVAHRLLPMPGVGSLAAALAATTGILEYTASRAFVDVEVACLTVAGCRVLLDATWRRHYAAAGLFLGFLIATKYTGLLITACVVSSTVLTVVWRRQPWRQSAQGCLWLLLVAVVVGSPVYVRNAWSLGTPIYPPPPGLAKWVKPRALSPAAVKLFHDYIEERGRGFGRSGTDLFLSPVRVTFYPAVFHAGEGAGLVALALAPWGFWIVRREAAGTWLLCFCFLFWASWFYTQQEGRFLTPVMALLTAVSSVSASWLSSRTWPACRWLIWSLLLLHIAYGTATVIKQRQELLLATLSASRMEAYRLRYVDHAAAYDFLNRRPQVSKVLLLDGFVCPYYLDHDYVCILGLRGEQPWGEISVAETLSQTAQFGVSHVLDIAPFRVSKTDARFVLLFETPESRVYGVE